MVNQNKIVSFKIKRQAKMTFRDSNWYHNAFVGRTSQKRSFFVFYLFFFFFTFRIVSNDVSWIQLFVTSLERRLKK